MDSKAQGNQAMLFMMFFLFLIFIIPYIGPPLGYFFGYMLVPLIGFDGKYPILTLTLAALFVVVLSSLFNSLMVDWKKMGRAQEISKAFNKELNQARRANDMAKVKKLMSMQSKIMQLSTEASFGTMKAMIPLTIFIIPIFFWLRAYLSNANYLFFTVPWADRVALYERTVIQHWMLLYFILALVIGQVARQAFKVLSLSDWWQNIKGQRKSAN